MTTTVTLRLTLTSLVFSSKRAAVTAGDTMEVALQNNNKPGSNRAAAGVVARTPAAVGPQTALGAALSSSRSSKAAMNTIDSDDTLPSVGRSWP